MFRLICALLLASGLVLASAPAAAQEPWPAEGDFARQMLPRLQKVFPQARLEPDADQPLVIHLRDDPDWGEDAIINLHRIYYYCAENPPADCEQVVDDFLSRIGIRPDAPDRANLRVIVRDRQYFDYLAQTLLAEGIAVPHRQIGDDLYALLAIDSPETISIVQGEVLGDLGLEEEAAWQLASRQTRAIIPPLPDPDELGKSLLVYQDFEYLPGLLFPPEDWAKIAEAAGPDLFMTSVSDYLLVVGLMPPGEELERFRQSVVEDCNAQPRCLSPNIYRWREGRWVIAP